MSSPLKSNSKSVPLTSIRKFSEDPRLRPFLSSHFDPQAYIKGVISDGKSEESFEEISASIEEVNEEIKGYISAHHENLMGGMQDVALLATRYSNLSHSAKKIKANIDQLKQEAYDCHELIRSRSSELERIHQTSILLRQFRQFIHAKGQLDYYIKSNQGLSNEKDKSSLSKDNILINGVSFDIRNLANTAAKLVYELETLIHVPILCDIKAVSSSSESITQLGRQLRHSAQDRFLASIKERSQASIAACLQIFFHLNSLPEVLLLAVDSVVKTTAEVSSEMLDLTALVNEHNDLASQSATARASSLTTSSLTSSSTTLSQSSGRKGNQSLTTVPFPITPAIRRSLKDIVNSWATYLFEQSLQINILQRVIAKKEDPNTQKKFLDILKSAGSSNPLLANGKLLELFWQRLIASLQDICNRIVKTQPVASSRIYPYLRRAAEDIVISLKEVSIKDQGRDNATSFSIEGVFGLNAEDPSDSSGRLRSIHDDCSFGSLYFQPFSVLDSINFGASKGIRKPSKFLSTDEDLSGNHRARGTTIHDSGMNSGENDPDTNDTGLLYGLKPFRDRYLVGSLSRMNFPVHQMFPEMEGYTAAIPSKRDLQTLVKAIQTELVSAIIEGDLGLIRLVSREAIKSLQLIASKVEDMILNTNDARKINPANSFAKNHAQDHNCQLITLLYQLKEAVKKLPEQVLTSAISEINSGSSTQSNAAGSSTFQLTENLLAVASSSNESINYLGSNQSNHHGRNGSISSDILTREISSIFAVAVSSIDDLSAKQLYTPLLDNVMTYIKSVLITIPKESSPFSVQSNAVVDCSKSVQIMQKQLPELLQSFLLGLPKSTILKQSLEEFSIRLMHLYVTIAANIRPVNEYSRLRTSQDLSAIEDLLVSVATISERNTCKVVQEIKAYRRLLFMGENSSSKTNNDSNPPTKSEVLELPYIQNLRPSTLLSYLISCAPPQFPSPSEVSGFNLGSYVDLLTSLSDEYISKDAKPSTIVSVRGLYYSSWKRSKAEQQVWAAIQVSLETFLQRISVMDPQQKIKMRLWYDLVLDLGNYYFDK